MELPKPILHKLNSILKKLIIIIFIKKNDLTKNYIQL